MDGAAAAGAAVLGGGGHIVADAVGEAQRRIAAFHSSALHAVNGGRNFFSVAFKLSSIS